MPVYRVGASSYAIQSFSFGSVGYATNAAGHGAVPSRGEQHHGDYRYAARLQVAPLAIVPRPRTEEPAEEATGALQPGSLVHTRALGTPTVSPTITPASLVHTRALGTPSVNVNLAPASLVHARALGTPTVSPSVNPPSLVHARALGTPDVDTTGPTAVAGEWSLRRRKPGRRRVG